MVENDLGSQLESQCTRWPRLEGCYLFAVSLSYTVSLAIFSFLSQRRKRKEQKKETPAG